MATSRLSASVDEQVYRVPLQIYILWQSQLDAEFKDQAPGAKVATALYDLLCRNIKAPIARGVGIPTYFRNQASGPSGAPLPIPFGEAVQICVIALINADFANEDAWTPYLSDLLDQVSKSQGKHCFLPVALSSAAIGFEPTAHLNAIRADLCSEKERASFIQISVAHELCRLVGEVPPDGKHSGAVKLFISHAKSSGEVEAKELKERIENTHAERFFDAVSIAPGFEFKDEIEDGIRQSTMVALLTDTYSTRPWCCKEVLWAKEYRRPMIVVDALQKEEPRSFPYIGNCPVLRWSASPDAIVLAALVETVRFRYQERRLSELKRIGRFPSEAVTLLRAPELIDCVELARRNPESLMVLYPDPPLGIDEASMLHQQNSSIHLIAATSPWPEASLKGKRIGISVSDAPDLYKRGLSATHVNDAANELARFLLAYGASLGYGGDLRKEGFTDRLVQMVYSANGSIAKSLLTNYEAWYIHKFGDQETLAWARNFIEVDRLPIPQDLAQWFPDLGGRGLDQGNAGDRFVMARCLTEMRQKMNREIDARVMLAGAIYTYAGVMPGLLEEALLALDRGIPLFLMGGFGGLASVLVDALCGGSPAQLALGNQLDHNKGYAELLAEYPQRGYEQPDYERALSTLQAAGPGGLNNGLTVEQNLLLMKTMDIDAMSHLILTGLRNRYR